MKLKMYALSILLAGKVVDETAIEAVMEEIMVEGNVIIKVAEKIGETRGAERREEEIARKMLYRSALSRQTRFSDSNKKKNRGCKNP